MLKLDKSELLVLETLRKSLFPMGKYEFRDISLQTKLAISMTVWLSDRGMEVVRSEGPYLYTKEGQKILDAAGGAIVSNIGYGREEVAEAVKLATKNNSYVLPPY